MTVDLQEDPLDTFQSREILGPSVTPKMVSFIMSTKLVKTKEAAGIILILIIVLALAAIAVIFIFKPFSPKFPTPPGGIPMAVPGQVL
jgi:hypothetical protein